ncbi:MAG: hypothetical protein IPJ32_15760 [Sphingobacteriaceae bacterium]|nr:hypothetical protein [Sphingobacteriaceae bacterium]
MQCNSCRHRESFRKSRCN